MKDLKHKVVRGSIAKIISQIAYLALRLGSLVILARLLDPKDFGLVAMVTGFTGIFSIIKDAGLSMATVQRDTLSHEQMSTLFWINAMLGLALAFLIIAIAPLIVAFYSEPRLFWVAMALAADFFFIGITAQHSALLQRQMRFGAISVIEFFTQFTGSAVAIFLAAYGYGYWALVAQVVTLPVISTIGTWAVARWIPGMPRRKIGIRSMLLFGGTITLNNFIVYIAFNFEKILMGRFWGAEALGMYGKAFQLINLPFDTLNSAIHGVAFSALSRIQDDPNRQNRFFLKGYSLLLTLTFPIIIACAVFAEDIILVVLGTKWEDAVPIFRFLTPTVMVYSMTFPFGWFLTSTGRQGRSLKMGFAIAPLVIVAVIIGIPHGPVGVAMSYSTAMTIWLIPCIIWTIHGTGIYLKDILLTLSLPLISSIVAAMPAFGIHYYYCQLLTPFLRLTLVGSVMVLFYIWMLLYVMKQKTLYLDILQGLKRRPADADS